MCNCMCVAIQAFLRDEFSEENAIFWQKCEHYRKSTDAAYRKQLAQLIYVDHVAESSVDQVNIDAEVRQTIERRLTAAPVNLLDAAQRQIYLLMKYDPYPRYVNIRRNAEDILGLLPPPFEELEAECDGEKEHRRRSLLPNWIADRRRRTSVRDELDAGGPCKTGGGVTRRESSSGLARFIKRLSHGDRKAHAPVPSAPPQRRPAEPATPSSSARTNRPPPLTGSKRHAAESSRTLASRRSTSVLGLNTVGTASQKTQLGTRSAAQRAIRYR